MGRGAIPRPRARRHGVPRSCNNATGKDDLHGVARLDTSATDGWRPPCGNPSTGRPESNAYNPASARRIYVNAVLLPFVLVLSSLGDWGIGSRLNQPIFYSQALSSVAAYAPASWDSSPLGFMF
jgi:hypothetical protein